MWINPYVFKKPTYALDGLSTSAVTSATGLYSVKRLLTSYTGPTVKLAAGINGVGQDFYSDSSNNLWTGANGTGLPYATWLGANTPYVTTWYDQSGKGNHATQSTNTLYPTLGTGTKGYVVDMSNNGYFNLPAGTVPSNDSSYTVTYKNGNAWSGTSSNTYVIYFSGVNGGTGTLNGFVIGTPVASPYTFSVDQWWNNNDVSLSIPGNVTVMPADASITNTYLTGNPNNTGRKIYYQGTLIANPTQSGIRYSYTSPAFIGHSPYFANYAHPMKCLSIFSTVVSAADQTILESQ